MSRIIVRSETFQTTLVYIHCLGMATKMNVNTNPAEYRKK